MLPDLTEQEREHAAAELRALGIRNNYRMVPNDAYAFLDYVLMAVRFALIVRPDFRELRLAAAMAQVWREVSTDRLPGAVAEIRGAAAAALESWGVDSPEQAARLLQAWARRQEMTTADVTAVLEALFPDDEPPPAVPAAPVDEPPPPVGARSLGGLLDIVFDPDPAPEVLERLAAGLRAA